ncbi:MAG: hypothetical protein ACLQDQ_02490 [Myxococcaceae bacterium]
MRSPTGAFTSFDAPDANSTMGCVNGTVGTFSENSNDLGETAGAYCDANGQLHGFVRTPSGVLTEFDAPGADQGTIVGTLQDLNLEGTTSATTM